MKKMIKQFSWFLSLLLVLQLLAPVSSAFAATPGAPANVQLIQMNPSDIRIVWDSVAGASSYKLYKLDGAQKTLVSSLTGTSYVIRALAEGTYTYAVTALAGTSESALSNSVSTTIVYPVMAAPTGLTASILYGSDVQLKWTAAQYASSYNIYKIQNGVRTLVENTTGTSRYLTKLPEGTYNFALTSVHALYGESELSQTVTADVVYPTVQAPPNFTYKVLNGNDLQLTWGTSQYATSYKLFKVENGVRTLLLTSSNTAKSYYNMPEGPFTYEVTAVSDRFGESAPSVLTGEIVYPELLPPTEVKTYVGNGNDLSLYWDAAQLASGYKIYKVANGTRTLVSTVQATNVVYTKMPAGPYRYEVTTYSDRFGESKSATAAVGEIIYPVMQPPASFSTTVINGNDLQLKWPTVEYANSYNVYQIKDGVRTKIANRTVSSIFVENMPQGPFEYEVTSVSDRFGESQEARKMTGTIIYPELQAPVITLKPGSTTGKFVLEWPLVEFATVYKIYRIVDGNPVLFSTTNAMSYNLNNLENDLYYFAVTASNERFGESPLSNQVMVNYDLTAPTTATNIQDKWYSTTVDVNLVAKDDRAGVDKTYYSINDGEWQIGSYFTMKQEGVYKITYYSVDKAGNVEAKKTVDLKIDLTAPTTVSSVTDLRGQDDTVTLTATDNLSNGIRTFYAINDGGLTEGTSFTIDNTTRKVAFYSMDAAGNVEKTVIMEAPADIVPPVTVSDVKEGTIAKAGITFNLTATDDNTGVDKTFHKVDNGAYVEGTTFTVSDPGAHKVYFYSTDKSGNIEKAKLVNVMVDTIAPTTKANTLDKWYNNDVTVGFNAIDDLSGVANTYYAVGSSAYTEGKAVKLTEEGIHQVSFYSVDNVGNEEQPVTVSVKIDKTAPVTTTNVNEEQLGSASFVELLPADDRSGLKETWFSINGGEFQKGTSIDFGTTEVFQISFYSVDLAGNIEPTQTFEIKRDKTAPVTVSDIVGEWTAQDVTVHLTATDDESGVEKTFYSIDGGAEQEGTEFKITEPGLHSVIFYSVDQAGNIEAPVTQLVKIDRTAPETLSGTTPEWTKNNVSVILAGQDAQSGVDKSFYSLNGAPLTEGVEFLITAEGEHILTFYSVDKVGNKEELKTAEIKIDKTAPVTQSNIAGNKVPQGPIELTATDDRSGVAKTLYSVDGGAFIEGSSFLIEAPGPHTVSYYSVDNAGNKEAVVTLELTTDQEPPVTVSDAPTDWVKEDVIVHLTATDAESGVAQTLYSIDGGEYQNGIEFTITEEGEHTITFYSIDNAGNKEDVKSALVKLDKTAPITTADAPAGWVNAEAAIKLTAKDELSGVKKTYYSVDGTEYATGTSVVIEEPGVHVVSFYSVDNAGNEEQKQIIEVKVDVQAPATAADVNQEWTREAVTGTLSATDDLSGVAKTFYSVDGAPFTEGTEFTVDAAGPHTVRYYSVDNAGNIEAIKSVKVQIDELPPVTVSDAPAEWNKSDVNVTLTATDDQSGVAHTFYSVDGADYTEGTSFTVSGEGIHQISFYSVDNAGNIERAVTQDVKIDLTAPVTTATAPAGWVNQAAKVALTATDNLSGVMTTYYSVNGAPYVEGAAIALSESGLYEVTFYSVDIAGNQEAAQSIEVKVDLNAPVTVADVNQDWTSKSVTGTLTATDDLSGVAKTYFSIDGADYSEGTTFTVDAEGIHQITFYSVDNAGNQEKPQTVEVKIDRTAPVTVSDAPKSWVKQDTLVHLTATDNLSGVAKTFYSVDGGALQEGLELNVLGEGVHTITYYSVDNAGNVEAVKTEQVMIDKTAPVVELLMTEALTSGQFKVNYKASDALSGIATEVVTVNGVAYKNGDVPKVSADGKYTVTVTVTDRAGNVTVVTKTYTPYIVGELIITPKTMNINKGVFTARVNLPSYFSGYKFDLSTVTLNGVKPITEKGGSANQAANGMFKFERTDYNWQKGEVFVELRGLVNGQLVIASTTIKVIK